MNIPDHVARHPATRASGLLWATGPLDSVWHPVEQSRFGALVCACGHQVIGPVHLRRYRPARGELGRGHCPALCGHRAEHDTDQWLLPALACDETAGRTAPEPPPQHTTGTSPDRPHRDAA